MSEVKRFIGIGRRIFHHNRFVCGVQSSVVFLTHDILKRRYVMVFCDNQIQKALDHVKGLHQIGLCLQLLTDLLPDYHRIPFDLSQQWKNNQGDIPLKVLSGSLKFNLLYFYFKEMADGFLCLG